MSKVIDALNKYENAREAIAEDIQRNEAVFKAHERLVGNLIDAENSLRDIAAEEGKGDTNGTYTVTVTPQTQTFVDLERLAQFVAEGKITQELSNELITINPRPPKISITGVPVPVGDDRI